MMNHDDIFNGEALIQTAKANYYLGTYENGEEFLVESSKNAHPTLDEVIALKNDFEITRNLRCAGVLKSRELIMRTNGIAIIKDYFDGITLGAYLSQKPIPLSQFLAIAIRLTHIIGELHLNQIIHKDINPENILISRNGEHIEICYFGIASQLAQETQGVRLNESLKGALTHISPEQTGRMNRSIDYRSDLYSLGVIFYQTLCGKLPFEYNQAIEIIHAHIARYPPEPSKQNPTIPQTISNIVMKLLAKNAEDRYQSASGLEADLLNCLEQWEKNEKIIPFDLAENDYSPILNISEKLYGREDEIETLIDSFHRIKSMPPELILVGGYSGIGKTRLVNEIDKPVSAANGYFVSGKFDQYSRDTPYTAISQAFGSLIRQLLCEHEAIIGKWRNEILSALQGDAQILIEVIPELELLIGQQNPVLKLGPSETAARFNQLFQQFLKALSSQEQPLVIFIDDLQWTDSGSYEILYQILTNKDLRNILILGAYRDNEVSPGHPLMMFTQRLNQEIPGKTHTILLTPLDMEQTNQFIADSLRLEPSETDALSALIMKKTGGNPFFIKQFIKQLSEDKLIRFDAPSMKWTWDAEAIHESKITENVVELLVNKIRKLKEGPKQLLQLASCIGNSFDIKTLSIIAEQREAVVAEKLWELVKEGFINPSNKWNRHAKDELWAELGLDEENNQSYDFFYFQHDRIQQAAYSLIEEIDQKKTHIKIGRLLLRNYEESNRQDYLFDMLKHLNFSSDLIINKEEKNQIARLNLKAGEKAKQSNAYQPALSFFRSGMTLLDSDKSTDLYHQLLLLRSETEYLCGHHSESEQLFNQAIGNASSKLEKSKILAGKMSLYENTNRQQEAIRIALEGLRMVGIHLPEKPGKVNILIELLKAKFYLRNKRIEDLQNNKDMDSPELLSAMKILVNLWGPAYLYNQNLLALAILRMVILSTRYGNSPESALAYSFYGFVLCAQLKAYKSGHEFAELGIWLNEKFDDKRLRSKVYVIYGGCVAHWRVPYRDLIDRLYKAYEVGIESNDLIYASYAFSFHGKTKWFKGDNLLELRNLVDNYALFCQKIMFPLNIQYMLTLLRPLYQLTNTAPNPDVFHQFTDEETHVKYMQELAARDGTYLFVTTHYIYQGEVAYHLGHYEESILSIDKANKTMEALLGLTDEVYPKFFYAMSLMAISLKDEKKRFNLKVVKDILQYFKKISDNCPDNFQVNYFLLQAEWERWHQRENKAANYYMLARKEAQRTGFLNLLSIAQERSARFYAQLGHAELADYFIKEAYATNEQWGASAKLELLQKEFKHLPFKQVSKPGADLTESSSFALDLQSIFKASTTISGEIVFERLAEKLLRIIIENAGAQKAVLILNDQGLLKVEAIANHEEERIQLLNSQATDSCTQISHAVVQLAFHTGETILLSDATLDSRFSKDPYISREKVKSLLCMPIKQFGKTLALIYLENNIASGAFTPSRLELLNLLSGQMAISLENSLLYQNLEQKVTDRTETIERQKKELESEKEKSESLLLNILPFEIAEELKRTGSYKPRKYENVSILFADFEGFTSLSGKISTEELVDMIDYCYKGFDQITTKHHVEKIKTIGDAYMCVSGLPNETPEHAINAIHTAFDILDFVEHFNEQRLAKHLQYCRIRVGIHSGPVAAGIVGSKKFAYDIWGDSVNVASRLEGAGEGGKINVSQSTYELIKDQFDCVYRGKIHIKNKGEIDMYFVEKRKEP